ncbi:hypothetical protein SY83_00915 [Paenibacillus swuensis]|uniref:O-antigen ligase-related domain-containing protein n=1 Tax=Paenibacillus swuensis TaxID=1178515 RepID=A0A172TE06_9BACL|nr:O-antigen ligase family protein [Paenibacillus swuensis]ANE45137.1 hypothetical protein SY83_00915 [Paenibacillus swuensis]
MKSSWLALLIGLVCMLSAFRRGLFFDKDFYTLQWVLFGFAAVCLVYAITTRLLWIRTSGWALLPFSMALFYTVSTFMNPASVGGTIHEALRWTAYGCFLWLCVLYIQHRSHHRAVLNHILTASGLFILAGAWSGFYGLLDYPEIVQHASDERLSALGLRLSGYFQYANMFGAVMGAYLLYTMGGIVSPSSGQARSTTYLRIWLQAIPLVPYATAILLTESRGAWIAIGIGWMAGWICIAKAVKFNYALLSVLVLCAAGIAHFTIVSSIQSGPTSFPGIYSLIVISIILSMIIPLIVRLSMNRVVYLGSSAVIALGMLLFSFIIPATTTERVSGHYETANARAQFYNDAMTIISESPWAGSGGNSWGKLYTSYQSNPYVGSEVHSGYLDIWMDTGTVGGLLFIVMLLLFAVRVARRHSMLLAPLAVLFAHSAVDFDMSYGFFWILSFLWIALGGTDNLSLPRNHNAAEHFSFPWQKRATFALLLLLSAGIFYSVRMDAARFVISAVPGESLPTQAVRWWNSSNPLANRSGGAGGEPGLNQRQTALRLYPYSADDRLALAERLPKRKAIPLLKEGLRYEPRNPELHWQLGIAYSALGQMEAAEGEWQTAVESDPYDKRKQEQLIQLWYEAALQAGQRGEAEVARDYAVRSLDAYEAFAARARQADPEKKNDRLFFLTERAREAAIRTATRFQLPIPE